MTANLLDNVSQLTHRTTLHAPTLNTRSWSSRPHLDARSPLLATATSDKNVHVWDMRDWKLLSTIAGGHKRSVRCVGWKDYGTHRRKKQKQKNQAQNTDQDATDSRNAQHPVILATGSFDANCGLWVWNPDFHGNQNQGVTQPSQAIPGSFGAEEEQERDFTNEVDESEEWHFSTLLTGPDSEIKDLQFSPPHYGANLLATCSRDKSVWVWEEVEPEEWETVAVLGEHAGDVKCLGWLEGARTSKKDLRIRLQKRQEPQQADSGTNREADETEDDAEDIVLGGRELLVSGSYDDTIRLHHDDEAEGDWLTIAVLTGHEGTVWDVKFEPYVSLASYGPNTSAEEIIADWSPRLISCSDDLTIRLWSKQLNEKEREERTHRLIEARKSQSQTSTSTTTETPSNANAPPTGFMSSRLPSVIRPPTSNEKWIEETQLPTVHVRSIYAIDWSASTGLIVSCGGDGLIVVYREVPVSSATTKPNTTTTTNTDDIVMNGTDEHEQSQEQPQSQPEGEESPTSPSSSNNTELKKVKTEWQVLACIEAAHDEYEVNHVCWAPARDKRRQLAGGDVVDGDGDGGEHEEEYIVSTGDDGQVRVWRLPEEVLAQVRREG